MAGSSPRSFWNELAGFLGSAPCKAGKRCFAGVVRCQEMLLEGQVWDAAVLASHPVLPQRKRPPSLHPGDAASKPRLPHNPSLGSYNSPKHPPAASGVLRRVSGAWGGCYELFGMGPVPLKELEEVVPSTEKL